MLCHHLTLFSRRGLCHPSFDRYEVAHCPHLELPAWPQCCGGVLHWRCHRNRHSANHRMDTGSNCRCIPVHSAGGPGECWQGCVLAIHCPCHMCDHQGIISPSRGHMSHVCDHQGIISPSRGHMSHVCDHQGIISPSGATCVTIRGSSVHHEAPSGDHQSITGPHITCV